MKKETKLKTKLKTLEELKLNLKDREIVRQEAIEWIKHIKRDIKEIQTLEIKYQSPLQKVATYHLDQELEAQVTWIKMFFNIKTELKRK